MPPSGVNNRRARYAPVRQSVSVSSRPHACPPSEAYHVLPLAIFASNTGSCRVTPALCVDFSWFYRTTHQGEISPSASGYGPSINGQALPRVAPTKATKLRERQWRYGCQCSLHQIVIAISKQDVYRFRCVASCGLGDHHFQCAVPRPSNKMDNAAW